MHKMFQHRFGNVKVVDDAIFQWADHRNMLRCAPHHFLRFRADRDQFIGFFIDCYYGRLVQYDAFAFYIDQDICCP